MSDQDPHASSAPGTPPQGLPPQGFQPSSQPGLPPFGSSDRPQMLPPAPVVFRAEPKRRGGPSAFAVIFTLAALLCVGGIAFAAGRLTAPAAAATTNTGANGGTGFGGTRRFPNASPGASFPIGGFGGGAGALGNAGVTIEGTVASVAADGTITLNLTGGGTLTVATDGSTTYHTASAATASSVATGDTVKVQLSARGLGGGFGTGAGGAAASGAPTTETATDILVVTP